MAENDFINGRGGFDLATYNNIYFSTGAVTVNMGAGTATGDASVGSDTLRSIEAVQGTNFNDIFNATTYGQSGALNVSNSNGTFNQFEGLGGNDTIAGNGNTRLIFSSATGPVTINLQGGTAGGNASVGTDTFTGVNSVTGSNLNDVFVATGFVGTGPSNTGTFNLFEDLGGDDNITGNGNTRVAFSQSASGVNVDLSTGTATGELSPNFGDGRGRSGGGGCGLTVGRLGDDLDPVGECHTENEFWQLVMTIETAPAFLCALDQFEDHRERGPV